MDGDGGLSGLGGLAPTLPPRIRGPLAYILGHRYLGMGKQDTAAADGPPDSPLRRLAQTQTDRLADKPPPP